MNVISILARRASLVAIKQRSSAAVCKNSFKALASQVASLKTTTRLFATQQLDNDDVDYNDYEGSRFQQDLDEMHRATESIQCSLEQLKEARTRHLKLMEASGIPDATIVTLLEKGNAQEAVLSNQLEILKEYMSNARRTMFAVDAPDGTPDFELNKNQEEVKQIIDFAAAHEDMDQVLRDHDLDKFDRERSMRFVAVDAPDGTPDDEMHGEKKFVDNMIAYAAEHENTADVIKRHKAESEEHEQVLKVLAVNAPDGSSDDEVKVDEEAVDHIIKFAANNEDTAEVRMRHRQDAELHARNLKTLAVDAPDGTSDDEMSVDMDAIDEIVNFAAENEDVTEVEKEHQRDEEIRVQNLKIVAVDAPDGVSDDEVQMDMEAIESIIKFAAKHEDAEAIILHRQRERQEYIARMNRIRDENSW